MILKVSTQYKKDLKRYQNKPSKITALKEVLKHLKKSGSVPAEYKPHMLSGKLKGFMECHVVYTTVPDPVVHAPQKGIYIQNGKKKLVK